MSFGSAVAVVGSVPTPAPRMLHQSAHLWRMSATPLRPVSMIMCGSKPGMPSDIAFRKCKA